MPLPTLLALIILPCAWVLERHGLLRSAWKTWSARLLINVFYPSLILASLPTRIGSSELLELWPLPLAIALLLLLGEWVGYALLPWSQLHEPAQERSFVFLAILPNYSYLPLLLAQNLWGERGIALVILCSVGADLVLWGRSVSVLSQKSGFFNRQLLSMPLLSLGLALILVHPNSQALRDLLKPGLPFLALIGKVTIPLSMFLLGSHLGRRFDAPQNAHAHRLLLLWRLLLAPACVYICLLWFPLKLPFPAPQVLLLIATMPGAIVSVVLSEHYQASPSLAARHVLLGHLLWPVSSFLWMVLGFNTL